MKETALTPQTKSCDYELMEHFEASFLTVNVLLLLARYFVLYSAMVLCDIDEYPSLLLTTLLEGFSGLNPLFMVFVLLDISAAAVSFVVFLPFLLFLRAASLALELRRESEVLVWLLSSRKPLIVTELLAAVVSYLAIRYASNRSTLCARKLRDWLAS